MFMLLLTTKKKKSRLLYYLNLGRIYHIHRQYHASNQALYRAKSLMQELYTQSLSKKAQALILNDQYDIYYGEKYEHSLVYFYLSLNHFMLWQRGQIHPWLEWEDGELKKRDGKILSAQERKNSLMAARAELLDWDSFLKEGHSDILAKIYGGLVHETVNTRNDQQIALQLYKDALNLLKNQYKKYPNFRQPEKEKLNALLKEKIRSLTKKTKPDNNITVILQSGQMPLKMAQKHYYSLEKAINRSGVSGIVAQVGAAALTLFASKQLGLLPPPQDYSPQAVYSHLHLAEASIRSIAISFELPKIALAPSATHTLVVSQKGNVFFKKNIPIASPLGDIAAQTVAQASLSRYGKVGLRLASKYAALIASTYTIFKKNDNPLARQAALLSFSAGSHLIGQSEKADLRHWSTLPQDIRILNFYLPPDNYEWKLYKAPDNPPIAQGSLSIKKEPTVLNIQELSP